MSDRRFRRIAGAVAILAMVALAPPPAQAREIGWRDGQLEIRELLGNFQQAFQNALRRLFELSRGGMDPNGLPTGGG
jgi:hypothetical protein